MSVDAVERCVVCHLSLLAGFGGLCEKHRYDEQPPIAVAPPIVQVIEQALHQHKHHGMHCQTGQEPGPHSVRCVGGFWDDALIVWAALREGGYVN